MIFATVERPATSVPKTAAHAKALSFGINHQQKKYSSASLIKFSKKFFLPTQLGWCTTVHFSHPVNINAITTHFTADRGNWPSSGTASLNMFSSNPLTSSDDPTSGDSVPVVFNQVEFNNTGEVITCRAADLDINLASGTHWIGLTPEVDFFPFGQESPNTFGQEYHQVLREVVGQEIMMRNPGGSFNFPAGTDWFPIFCTGTFRFPAPADGTITIEGLVSSHLPLSFCCPTVAFADSPDLCLLSSWCWTSTSSHNPAQIPSAQRQREFYLWPSSVQILLT